MAAKTDGVVFDQALQYLKNNTDRIIFCAGEPADYSDADTLVSNGGHKLAESTVSASTFQGESAGDTSGRKETIGERGTIPDESGDVDHVAYVDDGSNTLLHVHEADDGAGNALSVTADIAYNLQATDILEIRDSQTT